MRIIGQELEAMGIVLPAYCEAVVKRAIHTTADFDYARSLRFTPGRWRREWTPSGPGRHW